MPATPTRTLDVVCPKCMSPDDTVKLNLNDLSECECTGCGDTFTAAEAAAHWRAVAEWIDAAPAAEGGAA